MYDVDVEYWVERSKRLEKRLEDLRFSRQVLLQMLECSERDCRHLHYELEKAQSLQKKQQQEYLQKIMQQNCRIVEMQKGQA